jgi:hypothetical protein
MELNVFTSATDRPSVVNATCEMLTKKGKRCRRKCVLGEKSCRGHLKWEGECSICLEEFPNRELKCGHRFHRKCFERWKGTVRKLGRQGSVEVTCPLCRSSESKHRVRGIKPFEPIANEIQGSLSVDAPMGDTSSGRRVRIQAEGIEELSNVLQMLLPFPAQMIEQMAENLWTHLETI